MAFFFSRPDLRADLVQILGAVDDTSRIVQKFLLGRGDTSDLHAICTTIRLSTSIKERIELEKKMEHEERGVIVQQEWAAIDALMLKLHGLHDLIGRIQNAVMRTSASNTPLLPEGMDTDESNGREDTFVAAGWSIKPESVNTGSCYVMLLTFS